MSSVHVQYICCSNGVLSNFLEVMQFVICFGSIVVFRALHVPLSHGCSWAVLFQDKHVPNSKMIAVKIMKWIIDWKKLHFADLQKDAKSVAGFSSSCQFWVVWEWHHINMACLASTVQNVGLWSHFFQDKFLQDSCNTSEAEPLVSWKAKCLLAIGKDKQCTGLFGVTFFFKHLCSFLKNFHSFY